MEMYNLYSSREVKLLIVDAHSSYYNTLVLAVGDECFFLSLNLLVNCPLAMFFLKLLLLTNSLLTRYINTWLR